jgi:molybdenum cofactor biosynthesis enzyme MoaA
MKQVYFTGGEPFLHPSFRTCCEMALSHAPLTVVTNGLLIDDGEAVWTAELFGRSKYSFDLRISLDGMTPEQNDAVRGHGTFEKIVASIRRLGGLGMSPVVTVVQHETGLEAADARARFIAFVSGLGIRQPRVKFLPLLRIGREPRRTHGYDSSRPLDHAKLLPEVEATLLCSTGRLVTAKGVFTCPILLEHPDAHLGSRISEAMRPIRLNWSACQTCVLDGLRCNT